MSTSPPDRLITWQPRGQAALLLPALYDFHEHAPPVRREVPRADLQLILSFGPRLRIEGPDERAERRSFLVGLHDGPALTTPLGGSTGLQARLTPLAASRLLRAPLHLLHNQCPALEDVLGPDFLALERRLDSEPDPARRLREAARTLLARLLTTPAPPREVAWAIQRLQDARGDLPIQTLLDALGWSRKRLRDAFLRYVGVPPKRYARLLRFEHLTARLERGADLAQLALDAGFADQPHMSRDFHALAGQSPAAWAMARQGNIPSSPPTPLALP